MNFSIWQYSKNLDSINNIANKFGFRNSKIGSLTVLDCSWASINHQLGTLIRK